MSYYSSFNTLLIGDGGRVSNSGSSIGAVVGANSNHVTVTGPNSLLTNSGTLEVGSGGSFNTLLITNGGRVAGGISGGSIGGGGNANNNQVIVTGSNSSWDNGGRVAVGVNGSFNTLLITNGGTVRGTIGEVGRQPTASGNLVIVTGSNSIWNNSSGLNVGSAGSFNTLLITNGGTIAAEGLITVGGASTATNNQLVAVGASLSSVGLALGGRNNTITLLSNATWNVLGGSFIYRNEGSDNTLSIDATSAITNIGGLTFDQDSTVFYLTNTLGGYSFNGYTTNRLAFSPAGSGAVVVGESGTNVQLIISNYTLSRGTGTIGNGSAALSNLVTVSGPNSVWSSSTTLIIGNASGASGNQLVVSNGGAVFNTTGTLGSGINSSNNVALVTGTNSQWSNSGILTIGSQGGFNQLVISHGGVVANASSTIGNQSTSGRNSVLVTGGGSLWTNSGTLALGTSGSLNQLVVSNGGVVASSSGEVGGFGPPASSNSVVVTGAGSRWTVGGLNIGQQGGFNQLFISDGGMIASGGGTVGFLSTSRSNSVLVSGAGSLWSNNGTLALGSGGSFNQLVIDNGGSVAATGLTLGVNITSTNNRVTVDGGTLRVTNAGGTAVVDIRRGTNVLTTGLFVADRLLLTNGAQSIFTFDGGMFNVGSATVNNGVIFSVGNGISSAVLNFTGSGTRTFTNGLKVTGSGAVTLTNGLVDAGFLTMTNAGGAFTFNGGTFITRGGIISNGLDFIVGLNAGFTNATWDVRSNAATTTVADFLYVGNTASNARLLITNGGTLNGSLAFIGANPGGNSNAAIVSGPNSAWLNSGELDVGANGTFNTLLITNGGRVANGTGVIGGFSNNNAVTVTGSNSAWNNSGGLSVGVNGSFNTLLVTNAGAVTAANVFLGANAASTNNRVTVDGGTLRVTNAGNSANYDIRRGTNVLNAGLIEVDQLVMTLASGTFNFTGGTFAARTANVNNGARFTVGNGSSAATYRLSGTVINGHSFANGLHINTNAALTGNGTILGNATNFGTLDVGSSAGAISVNGDFRFQPAATAVFELGGSTPTNGYDQLTVTSNVQFGGTLDLRLTNGFLPAPGDTFTLVKFASSAGIFANAINGQRVSVAGGLASFHASYEVNLVLSDVRYVDSDGDGQGDLQELAAGTDPNDSNSYLHVLAVTQNESGHIVVQFMSVPGKMYRIEYSGSLATWNIATTNVPSAGATTSWIDDGSLTGGLPGAQRFYRVGLQ